MKSEANPPLRVLRYTTLMLHLTDIQQAAKLLENITVNTPLLKDQTASHELEASVFVKADRLLCFNDLNRRRFAEH